MPDVFALLRRVLLRPPPRRAGAVALLLALVAVAAPAVAGGPRTGTYRSDADGWSITFPKRWKYVEAEGRLVGGSDTEAGLLVVGFAPGQTLDGMEAEAARGIQEDGVFLAPRAPPRRKKDRVVVELEGMAQDGTPLRAYAVGVAGAGGGAFVIGITTPEMIGKLQKRVDEMAKSVKMQKPKAGAAGSLRGALCSFSGGTHMSSTARLTFDGRGGVTTGSETTFGGQLPGGDGRYSGYAGNQHDATGGGRYSVAGDQVTLRWSDGSSQRCRVNMKQPSGAITELMCGKTLYGTALCD